MAKKLSAAKLATLAESYYIQRQARLAAQHELNDMKTLETDLKKMLMEQLNSNFTTVGGADFVLTRVEKNVPVADDWSLIQAHVSETKEFDLLYRRINDKAVRERWDQGVQVPGIIVYPAVTLSVVRSRK